MEINQDIQQLLNDPELEGLLESSQKSYKFSDDDDEATKLAKKQANMVLLNALAQANRIMLTHERKQERRVMDKAIAAERKEAKANGIVDEARLQVIADRKRKEYEEKMSTNTTIPNAPKKKKRAKPAIPKPEPGVPAVGKNARKQALLAADESKRLKRIELVARRDSYKLTKKITQQQTAKLKQHEEVIRFFDAQLLRDLKRNERDKKYNKKTPKKRRIVVNDLDNTRNETIGSNTVKNAA